MSDKKVCPHGCGKEWVGSSNRHASEPLDSDAVAAANEATWNHCSRLTSDGHKRQLTMSDDDYYCRRVWMDAYLAALDKKEDRKDPPKKDPKDPVVRCETANLVVHVTDHDGKPVEGAEVTADGLGKKVTGKDGYADFGEVKPSTYTIQAAKSEHSPVRGDPEGPDTAIQQVPPNSTTVAELKLDPLLVILKENVIIIGSEMSYASFWLKMMFVAPGFSMADKGLKIRSADKKTIILTNVGYTRAEKLPLELIKKKRGYEIKQITSASSVVSHLNTRPEKKTGNRIEKTLLQDVVFFSHGLPNRIALNYDASPRVDITASNITGMKKDAFVPGAGRIYSYACRTGNSSWRESFSRDADADPDNSLAQKMANHFKVQVYAFLTRTFYGNLLRKKPDSARIASTLKTARKTQEGQIIPIPPEHEGLPHPGLTNYFSGAHNEGTANYALWRKAGAMGMPTGDSTPSGLSRTMRLFTPK